MGKGEYLNCEGTLQLTEIAKLTKQICEAKGIEGNFAHRHEGGLVDLECCERLDDSRVFDYGGDVDLTLDVTNEGLRQVEVLPFS
eukprot:6177032-Pleurochrysis_carterae.AAC.2